MTTTARLVPRLSLTIPYHKTLFIMITESRYWYRLTTYYCPICGKGEEYRERVYGEKPTDPYERYIRHEHYDYCDAF